MNSNSNLVVKTKDSVLIERDYDKQPFPAVITEVVTINEDRAIISFKRLDDIADDLSSCHKDFVIKILTPIQARVFC